MVFGMGKKRSGLTPRRKAFVLQYVRDHNGRQTAQRVGISYRTAKYFLLDPAVQAAIAELDAKTNKTLEITAERVKSEIARRAFSNLEDYVTHENGDVVMDLSKCSREQMAAVQEYTIDATGGTGDGERRRVLRTRLKLADSIRALELLARCKDINLLSDKVEITASEDVLAALAEGRKRVATRRPPR